jgi:BioD-like phosphotransacetylase family protein
VQFIPEFDFSVGEGMSRIVLSKKELAKLVLAEVRKNQGCEGVAEVVIVGTANPRSASNWEICMVVASSGDPSQVQLATVAAQRLLSPVYSVC